MRWRAVAAVGAAGAAMLLVATAACGGGDGDGSDTARRTERLTDPATIPTATGMKNPVTFTYTGGNVQVSGGAAPAAVGNTTPAPTSGKTYVVKPGDTCYGIALAHGISTADLLKANPSIDPSCQNIHQGDELRIPGAVAAPTAAATARPGPTATPRPGTTATSGRSYTVRAGDTCDDIARSYGVSLANLLAANPAIDSGCRNLQPGQVVKIP